MDDVLLVTGGVPLRGTLRIPGAKNASLPLMTLSLLTSEPIVLNNMPQLSDIDNMKYLLESLGVSCQKFHQRWVFHCPNKPEPAVAHKDFACKLRASFVVLGSLLARCGYARVALPGGCSLNKGARSIDFHKDGLMAFGAKGYEEEGYLVMEGPLTGGEYTFPKPSLTGTINLLCAATSSSGPCVMHNVAPEPEILDVAKALKTMGASITWIPSYEGNPHRGSFVVQGGHELKGCHHEVISDRLILGTYMVAAAMTKGHLFLEGGDLSLLPQVRELLEEKALHIVEHSARSLEIKARDRLEAFSFVTEPYPGFPTDLQAQFMALACIAEGQSSIRETIFNNRFQQSVGLEKMGASLRLEGDTAYVQGPRHLVAQDLTATDLRGSMSFVLAAMAAKGTSIIRNIHHLDRGYEALDLNLSECGALIHRQSVDSLFQERRA